MELDYRFKDKKGRCKLCHKLCFDSEEAADLFIATAPADLDRPLTYSYPCYLYPSGYWHVTSSATKPKKLYSWKTEIRKLGPERSERLFKRVDKTLKLPRHD